MKSIRDLVQLDTNKFVNNAVLTSDLSEVFEYENGKRTEKIIGHKATFVSIVDGESFEFVARFSKDVADVDKLEIFKTYKLVLDKEKTSIYVQNNSINASMWFLKFDKVNV